MEEGEQEHHLMHTALSQGAPSWASRSSQGGPKSRILNPEGARCGGACGQMEKQVCRGHPSQGRHKESRGHSHEEDLCPAGVPHWSNPKMKTKVREQSDGSVCISLQGTE